MSGWCLFGDEKREAFERDLKPEYLLDEIGKARNSYEFPSLVRELERIADVMEEVVEGEGE